MGKVKIYDVGIVGCGVAGSFAALRVAENFKDKTAIVFELGRQPKKRRRQLEGFLGSLPFGDGKLYLNDTDKVGKIADKRKVKAIDKWVHDKFSLAGSMKTVKNKEPSITVKNRLKALNMTMDFSDYVQWKPESAHKLSKVLTDVFDVSTNVEFSFDNEVHQILKKEKEGYFHLHSSDGDYYCKKVIIAVGRSGWRWAHELFNCFGLEMKNDTCYYGVTAEISGSKMKEFNKSHCSFENEKLIVGPLNWNGTIIPEDHADMVVSGFRSNEDRWKSEKVSFQIIGKREVKGNGVEESERLAKLAFLLLNDRIGKEKMKMLSKGKSTLNQLPEFDWLIDEVNNLEKLFPNLITKGNFHAPTIITSVGEINIKNNLETDLSGMFVTGESARLYGILASAISGALAVDGALK